MTRSFSKNTKGAMEMSVGTIVTIVLLMMVLVLGIFFIQKIFSGSNSAIDSVNSQLTSQINQLFSDGKASRLAIYPTSQQITIKKSDSTPKGFAFSVYNDANENKDFTYTVASDDVSNCGNTMTNQIADSYIIGKSGKFSLQPASSLSLAEIVLFSLPQSAPACTVTYDVTVNDNTGATYSSGQVFVTFQ